MLREAWKSIQTDCCHSHFYWHKGQAATQNMIVKCLKQEHNAVTVASTQPLITSEAFHSIAFPKKSHSTQILSNFTHLIFLQEFPVEYLIQYSSSLFKNWTISGLSGNFLGKFRTICPFSKCLKFLIEWKAPLIWTFKMFKAGFLSLDWFLLEKSPKP